MPEANSAPILSNPPSQLPTLAPDPAHKPKLPDRLGESLRSRHYRPNPDFRHGLFQFTHVDLFRLKIPAPIGACVAIKKAPSFPRKRESRESKFEPSRNFWATMTSRRR